MLIGEAMSLEYPVRMKLLCKPVLRTFEKIVNLERCTNPRDVTRFYSSPQLQRAEGGTLLESVPSTIVFKALDYQVYQSVLVRVNARYRSAS